MPTEERPEAPAVVLTLMISDPTTGTKELPAILTPEQAAPLVGLTSHTVRQHCAAGLIPTLPRNGKNGAWRIPTAKLLRSLGIIEGDSPAALAS
jgi:hypothetical protein